MESASKALEMAFAVFVFVMALGVSISNFSKARQTSEIVIRTADATTYYDYAKYDEESGTFKYQNGEAYSYTKSGDRIVGLETVIPTVYKYNKENYTVIFKEGSYDPSTGTYSENGNLEIYKTTTVNSDGTNNWSKGYKNDYNNSGTSSSIHKFDINEETQRHEPWVGSQTEIRKHLDAVFGGSIYHMPQYPESDTSLAHNINYSSSILNINTHSSIKFIEKIGKVETTTTGIKGNNTISKTIITYIKI